MERMKNNIRGLLTPEQVADILQIHVLTVYKYIRQGKVDAVRVGRSYRIVPEDLEHWIEINRVRK
jgi:excisionase family DNA binding protein